LATRTAHTFALDWTKGPAYAEALHGDLKQRIQAQLLRLSL
jgi:hypothetical protein